MASFEFTEDEVPYGILGEYGLTREMVEDLPENPYQYILRGLLSPALPIRVRDDKGNTVTARTRFRLVRTDDGSVDVLFYPRLMHCDLESYSSKEQNLLMRGRVILSHAPDDNASKCFVQVDPDTNQVMYIPTPVIGRNLLNLMDHFKLDKEDVERIQQGLPIPVTENDETLSIGLDLTEKTGIRIERGSFFKWDVERGAHMKPFNFGIYGCWIKDARGDLSYVPEEEYTEEILAQQGDAARYNAGTIKR